MADRDCARSSVATPARDSTTSDTESANQHGPFRIGIPGLLTLAIVYGYGRYGYGLFLPELRREFGGSTGVLGAVSSAGYLAELLVLVVVARLSGRRSPRVPVLIGGLCAATGMVLMATAHSTAVLAIGVALAGTAPGWVWAPYSDAVAVATRPAARGHALAMISTGTTFGVMVAGPAVLWVAGSGWRSIWLAAAACAIAVSAWNFRVLPATAHPGPRGAGARGDGATGLRWSALLRRPGQRRLLGASFSVGLGGAVYWSYAGMAVSGASTEGAPLLWTLIGVAGVIGVATGALVERWGMAKTFVTAQLCTALSCGILALGRPTFAMFVAAAALFGAGFMVAGALVALWSARAFADRPTVGFSVVVLALAAGSATGPAVFGILVDSFDIPIAFAVLSMVVAATLWFCPRRSDAYTPPDPQAHR
ncbi:putative MFS family arabinose efflux permease [Nocardia tenerifensis]|uniref:Putative MFS family arabinose efflux permease n=1 Tax=Nocardia tenerifensis TaxID=228006 RepID=A0A318JVF2_9NOCA|nr:MFS transporter [Nocardia tenerifensis]PXX58158.1 putative MFS family arabinose efflux permease [Nocardia tenerifensis]